jgi:hypothetical protein
MTERQRTVILIREDRALEVQQLAEGLSAKGLSEFNDNGESRTFAPENMPRVATRNNARFRVLDHPFPEKTAKELDRFFDPSVERRADQDAEIAELLTLIGEMREDGAKRRELIRPQGALKDAQAMRAAARATVVWLIDSRAPLERIFENRAEQGWVLLPPVEVPGVPA